MSNPTVEAAKGFADLPVTDDAADNCEICFWDEVTREAVYLAVLSCECGAKVCLGHTEWLKSLRHKGPLTTHDPCGGLIFTARTKFLPLKGSS